MDGTSLMKRWFTAQPLRLCRFLIAMLLSHIIQSAPRFWKCLVTWGNKNSGLYFGLPTVLKRLIHAVTLVFQRPCGICITLAGYNQTVSKVS